ncbi:VTC domain-containing protein [Halolactibacillus halophilus]|uniref:Molecular chaperone n=1 Tax=Halolactibacillus halophilus TaxID=306540 RepID=A0A1I5LZ60_9BACI|nr:polyphosphate polymerase domain-containing protein [Halolactibacillus halophilus]GEM00958.1 molecular chaperone [Halolactibacillus halophilus]SFP02648.1 VTC domain-containing protein [Halolactibacillus halophilus]
MSTGRHELKHIISMSDYYILRKKLHHLLMRDCHANDNGRYHIRSLYFDNHDHNILDEKKEGYLNRDKYRIRLYNYDFNQLFLERKSKRHNQTFKTKARLTVNDYQQLLRGETEWMAHHKDSLIIDFYRALTLRHLKPQTVIDYQREAFTYPYGNVRITFDSHVQSSLYNIDILNRYLPMVNCLEPNEVILEVKYDDYLPAVIKPLLQFPDTKQDACSKFQLSQMYG